MRRGLDSGLEILLCGGFWGRLTASHATKGLGTKSLALLESPLSKKQNHQKNHQGSSAESWSLRFGGFCPVFIVM